MKRCNKALAISCAAEFCENGADAANRWRAGKPVRVLRSGNGRKSAKKSPYLPTLGVRYDGIYKVVRYWPESRQGLVVWRYLLRRDDETPAPWTDAGKQRKRKLRQTVIMPDGYIEKKRTRKRKCSDSHSEADGGDGVSSAKRRYFRLPDPVRDLIAQDERNQNTWKQLMDSLPAEKEVDDHVVLVIAS